MDTSLGSADRRIRQKKRRRDADAAADSDAAQRTATTSAGGNHRLASRHTAAAHALVLLLSANLMFGIDAFSRENAVNRNAFGRAACDVPLFHQHDDAHGPAAGIFSNTKRYHRSGDMIRLSASRERTDISSTSSTSSSSSASSSRFGVRKRVKSVIQKAKSRKIAKAARTEAAEAEAEIQHIIEEDDKLFEEAQGNIDGDVNGDVESEIATETQGVVRETEKDSDGEVEVVNGASTVAQAEKEMDTVDDTKIPSPSENESQQISSLEEKEAISASKAPEDADDEEDDDDDSAAKEEAIIAKAEPFPFELPTLTDEQQRQLDMGERVQFQNDMGREGSGFVVLDVKAPPDVVWECLLDFQSYPETIPTVREVTMYTNTHLSGDYRSEKPVAFEDGTMATLAHGTPSVTRAAFTLSKFRLKIAAIHRYTPHPVGDYMVFTLDPACTNLVLKDAKGIWHTQSNPDNKGEVSSIEERQSFFCIIEFSTGKNFLNSQCYLVTFFCQNHYTFPYPNRNTPEYGSFAR